MEKKFFPCDCGGEGCLYCDPRIEVISEARSLLSRLEASGFESNFSWSNDDQPGCEEDQRYWSTDEYAAFLKIEEKFRKIFSGDYYRRNRVSDGLRFIIQKMEEVRR